MNRGTKNEEQVAKTWNTFPPLNWNHFICRLVFPSDFVVRSDALYSINLVFNIHAH